MILLALDLASVTGYALFQDGELKESGSVRFAEGREWKAQRYDDLHRWLNSLHTLYGFDRVAVEAPFIGKNARSAIALGEWHGVLKLWCCRHGIGLYDPIPPSEIKKTIAGKGNAKKEEVQAMVNDLLSLSITNLDESDAIAVGIVAIKKHGK